MSADVMTETDKANIRAQVERLRYPRRVTLRDVLNLKRPDNGVNPTADRGATEKQS